jgi:ATPase subunit of ABC transporter with duplicated ATPase domains
MSSIRLANVTFAYPQQISLIESCTLDLRPGWTGIVGRNGDGKTTLLDLIDGTRAPQSGSVDTGGLRLSRCRQALSTSTEVEEFATAWTPPAMKWMSLLDLDGGDFWRWDELSPGMRRRWQIGAALFTEPGALLLDEPTNHLDTEGRRLLIDALSQYDGVGVVVSHDRAFLDDLCDRTVRIRGGQIRIYPGTYSTAKKLWQAEERRALEQLEAAQATERALQAELARQSGRHASSERSLSSASRMTSIRDSDARSVSAKGRARRAESNIAREKSVTRAKLERVKSRLDDMPRPDSGGGEIFVDEARCRREFVLRLVAAPLTVGDRELADRVKLELRRDERVWLQGPNGCGKTTLLRAALDGCDLPPERVLYVPQRLEADALRKRLDGVTGEARSRALHVSAALNLDIRAVLDGTALSPGETRKLAIGLGLVIEPWLIVLDEPTNDLDVESIERLEDALSDYGGALLLVTHDRYFAEAVGARPIRPFA